MAAKRSFKQKVIGGKSVNKEKSENGNSGKKNKILIIVALLVLVVTVVEIAFIFAKNARESKRPVFVNSWAVPYKGYTSAGVYGDFLYVCDMDRGDVYKNSAQTGAAEKILNFPEGIHKAVADSKNDIYILTRTNEIIFVDGKSYEIKKRIKLKEADAPVWMEIDSKDNFFIVNGTTGHIIKYGPDFSKITAFAGRGEAKENLAAAGKIFIGAQDEVFAVNMYKKDLFEIKVYDNLGKYLRSWPITNIKFFEGLTCVVATNDGNIYINSNKDSKIFVFSSHGKFRGSFDSDKDGKFQIVNGAALIAGGRNDLIYVFSHKIAVLKAIVY